VALRELGLAVLLCAVVAMLALAWLDARARRAGGA
jgi:hypothetical protein